MRLAHRRPHFRPQVEALENRCVLSHMVLESFDLALGQKKFWDGEYVERAFVMPTDSGLNPEAEALVFGEHFDYQINVTEAGGYRLRVGIDISLEGFRGAADPVVEPSSIFRLQVLQDRDGNGRLEEIKGDFTLFRDFSTEIFVAQPPPGEYIVRVTPVMVTDRSFRMRAKLEEAPPTYDEPKLLYPNLRILAPFELTFATPTVTFGPGAHVPGQPTLSAMPDEIVAPDDGQPPTGLPLRFSAGLENAGKGTFMVVRPHDMTDEEYRRAQATGTEILAHQDLFYSSGYTDADRFHVGPDGSAGVIKFHTEHGHDHYEGIFTFTLWRVTDLQSGAMVQIGDGHKEGLNTSDERLADWGRFYQDPRATHNSFEEKGIALSAGWTDIYEWNRSGQYVDFPVNIDGTPVAGHYVVRGTADIAGHVVESNERDNISYAYVRVENTDAGPRITVLERGYGTDPWDHKKIVEAPFGSPSDPDDVIVGPVTVNPDDPVSQDAVLFFLEDVGWAEMDLFADPQDSTATISTSGTITADVPIGPDVLDRDSYFSVSVQADPETSELLTDEVFSLEGSGSLLGLLEFDVDASILPNPLAI